MGSFSIWHWLIVLAVIVLVFGTKKLRDLGPDLGNFIKGFRKSLQDDPDVNKIDTQKSDDTTSRHSKD